MVRISIEINKVYGCGRNSTGKNGVPWWTFVDTIINKVPRSLVSGVVLRLETTRILGQS